MGVLGQRPRPRRGAKEAMRKRKGLRAGLLSRLKLGLYGCVCGRCCCWHDNTGCGSYDSGLFWCRFVANICTYYEPKQTRIIRSTPCVIVPAAAATTTTTVQVQPLTREQPRPKRSACMVIMPRARAGQRRAPSSLPKPRLLTLCLDGTLTVRLPGRQERCCECGGHRFITTVTFPPCAPLLLTLDFF